MSYTTEFKGEFKLVPALNADQVEYLKQFALTRRIKRNSKVAENMRDTRRKAVNLPIGKDGEYFVGGLGDYGQNHDESIINYNEPPASQPNYWCKWTPSEAGDSITWNEEEEFGDYIEWLQYIIDNFLKPWGVVVSGAVKWRGEAFDDMGVITVENNVLNVREFNYPD